MHVCALEVVGEDLLEVIPSIDDVSWQMIQPGPSGISYIDWEELDGKEIVIRSARSTREAVVLQPDVGVGFVIILDSVA
jgi:hypothetical protein